MYRLACRPSGMPFSKMYSLLNLNLPAAGTFHAQPSKVGSLGTLGVALAEVVDVLVFVIVVKGRVVEVSNWHVSVLTRVTVVVTVRVVVLVYVVTACESLFCKVWWHSSYGAREADT